MIFARIFYPRIAAVIRALNIPAGAKVLEVGVGTGLALEAYPPHCQVLGVDLAPDMLEYAEDRIQQNGWRHVTVEAMDAMNLKLPDDSFDYVTAFHVVSVVPDATKLMREVQRVCRPGGRVVVINHFRSEKRLLAALDRGCEPLTRRWGWHTLERAEVFDGVSFELERVYKTSRHFVVHDRRGAQLQTGCRRCGQCRDDPGIDRDDTAPQEPLESCRPRVRSQRVYTRTVWLSFGTARRS
jgi:phosphatidylethanolamine/phosphatidyl-N-methylethanolamine N-methyltransferase